MCVEYSETYKIKNVYSNLSNKEIKYTKLIREKFERSDTEVEILMSYYSFVDYICMFACIHTQLSHNVLSFCSQASHLTLHTCASSSTLVAQIVLQSTSEPRKTSHGLHTSITVLRAKTHTASATRKSSQLPTRPRQSAQMSSVTSPP